MGTFDHAGAASSYQDSHLLFDFGRKAVLFDGQPVSLRRKEFDLLALLVRNAGQAVPRRQLLLEVWGYHSEVRTRTLDVHVRRLRKKLGPHADRYIETIFAVGYRFQPLSGGRLIGPLDEAGGSGLENSRPLVGESIF
jgi:DNA-binding response OmpR family regulator